MTLLEAAKAVMGIVPPESWMEGPQKQTLLALRAAIVEEEAREKEPDTFSLGIKAMEELATPWTYGPAISGPPDAFGLPPTPPRTYPGGTYEVTEIDHEAKSYTVEPARGKPEHKRPCQMLSPEELAEILGHCEQCKKPIRLGMRYGDEYSKDQEGCYLCASCFPVKPVERAREKPEPFAWACTYDAGPPDYFDFEESAKTRATKSGLINNKYFPRVKEIIPLYEEPPGEAEEPEPYAKAISESELAYCDKLILNWAEERKQRSTFNAATEAMDYFDHLVAEVRAYRALHDLRATKEGEAKP